MFLNRKPDPNNRAFTLIELLVVIAVVAIIAAILFPVFTKVREKARQTTCASNERQIGLAIQQYVQDNDELLPTRSPANEAYSWKFEIAPYLKSSAVFQCPSNPRENQADFNTVTGLQGAGVPDFMASYASNRGDGTDEPFIDPPAPDALYPPDQLSQVSLAMIDSPSQLIGIVESTALLTDFSVTSPGNCAQPTHSTTDSNGQTGHLFAGHTGVSNFLFLDGHVRAMHPLATLDRSDGGTGTVNMWTNDNKNFVDMASSTAVGDATGRTVLAYAENNNR